MKKILIALAGAISLAGVTAQPAAACEQGDVKCAANEVVELAKHATWPLLGDIWP